MGMRGTLGHSPGRFHGIIKVGGILPAVGWAEPDLDLEPSCPWDNLRGRKLAWIERVR